MNKKEQAVIEKIKNSKVQQSIINLYKKIDKKYIIDAIVIFIALAIGYILFTGANTNKDIKAVLKENEKLEHKIDSLKNNNDSINKIIVELEDKQILFLNEITKNNTLITKNNTELQKIKNIYNAKITAINSYTTSQLDSFFTERYKDYYNR
jgi:cell division protein FtsB